MTPLALDAALGYTKGGSQGAVPKIMINLRFPIVSALFALAVSSAFGQVSFCPQTGHYYELVLVNLDWEHAKAAASHRTYKGLPGHLATITSKVENDFVVSLGDVRTFWLGGYQLAGSPEPAGGWTWITGEPWKYNGWDPVQPDNAPGFDGNEDRLMYYAAGNGTWNDSPASGGATPSRGYVVEYEGSGVQLAWSSTYQILGSDLSARCMYVLNGNAQPAAFVGVWSDNDGTGTGVRFDATGGVEVAGATFSGFSPVDISSQTVQGNGHYLLTELGKQAGTNTRKVAFLGSDNHLDTPPISGDLDYIYQPGTQSLDLPLVLGKYPYATYATANVQSGIGRARQLVVLNTTASSSNPIVELADPDIAPSQAAFADSLILACGDDNLADARGGARATAYTINSDGSVSQVFSRSFPNSLAGQVFTSHHLMWGALSPSFNVLVDNQRVHDAGAGTITYGYTLEARDRSGNLLWKTNPGSIVDISVGSQLNTWALGTNGPGQFVVSFGLGGVLRKSQSTNAVRVASALDQGAVIGDNEIDASGHHRVHLTKYNLDGSVAWSATNTSKAGNDDFLSQLQWVGGRIMIAGQYVPPTGNKGVFSAEYDQTARVSSPETLITLGFDEIPGCGYIAGTPIPTQTRVSTQYLSTDGISISSGGGYASVTNNPGAKSTPNALGGSTPDNHVTYARANPVTFTFYDPKHPTTNGAVRYFSLVGDTIGYSGQTVTIQAYDVNGNLLGSTTWPDVGGEFLEISFPTAVIHKVVFLGSAIDQNGVAVDNVTFSTVVPVP